MVKKLINLLLGLFVLAFFLRVWNVTIHDSYTDEAINAFRSLGLIDYDVSTVQTTPWQWFSQVPWWAHLSFHDHPLGSFVFEHITLAILGENLWAVRLPSILSGLAVVLLLFFLGKELGGERWGIVAAAIGAVNSYLIWISRLGLQDGPALVFILLALLSLLKIRRDYRWWLVWGVALGWGITTKYTVLIVILLTFWFLLLHGWKLIKTKWFLWGSGLVLLLTMPSWLYNIMLYQATGHFDFQISAFLNQPVPQWSFRMGRSQVGGLSDRFLNFFLALRHGTSWLFLLISAGSLMYGGIQLRDTQKRKLYALLLGWTVLMWLWFFAIGSTYRFVVMIVPFFILLMAGIFVGWQKKWAVGLLGIFIVIELIFSINSFLLLKPKGNEMAYAKVNAETQNFGFNELDKFLNRELQGKIPALVGDPAYPFLRAILAEQREPRLADGTPRLPILIVYDDNLNFLASLWVFQRRLVYEGWPILSLENYLGQNNGDPETISREQGITQFMYITPLTETALDPAVTKTLIGKQFADDLKKRKIEPTIIYNVRHDPAFAVYQF